MKLRLKPTNTIYNIIIWLAILQLTCLRWFGVDYYVNYILFILILINCLKNYSRFKTTFLLLGLFLICSVINLFISGGSVTILIGNLIRIMRGFIIFVFFCDLIKYKPRFLINFMKKMFPLFNIYMIINIPVLIMQYNGKLSMATYYKINVSSYSKVDLTSGLFGIYGTPMLAIYSVFIFIYNDLYIRNYINRKLMSVILSVYNIMITAFNIYISNVNDNKGYYVLLLLFTFIYLYMVLFKDNATQEKGRNKIKLAAAIKVISIAFVIIGVVGVILFFYDKMFFLQDIVKKITVNINAGLAINRSSGSGERIAMIMYFFNSNFDHILFGYGLGKYSQLESRVLGFSHFGQTDLGAYLCLGGIIYIAIFLMMVLYQIKGIWKQSFQVIIVFLGIVFLMGYTRYFTNVSPVIASMFLLVSLWMANNEYDLENV